MIPSDVLRKFNRGWLAIVSVLSVLGGASGAAAQSVPQLDLNQFRPSELTTDGFAVSTADAQGHKRFGFQIYLDYSDDALVFEGAGGTPQQGQQFKMVHKQLTGHFTWSLGLWDHLVIFMDLPYSFILEEDLSAGDRAFIEMINQAQLIPRGSGLGDVYVGARGNLYGTRDDAAQIAVQATLTANTASGADSEQNYLGDRSASPYIGGWFELFATFNAGDHVRIPINLGYKTNFTQDVVTLKVGNQLTWAGAVQVLMGADRFMITAEAFGRTAAQSSTGFGGREETPVEILGGFKYNGHNGLAVGAAGSAGVTPGYGAPDWRVIGMIGFTMPERNDVVGLIDADSDGIFDDVDQCPNDPEDIDGFQDEDGCPDFDNDGDGVLDVNDGCPMDPEDIDGFEDEDGCPDPDNDGDGILDVDDMCPDEPGPPENNGCPDADRDGDGVPDRVDNCPDEPGTVENHGCQDAQLVVIGAGQLEILEKVYFKSGSAKLQSRSFALLDNVAAVLNAHPEIPLIRVEGHSDKTGSLKFNMRLSQKRAETVVRYMVGRGKVSKDRLMAEGFGPTRPIDPEARTKAELAQNRRVEFHIVEVGPEGPNDESGER